MARALVDEGVELTLCGGFGLAATAAVAGRVPVGHVTSAVDSVGGAASYSERSAAGPPH